TASSVACHCPSWARKSAFQAAREVLFHAASCAELQGMDLSPRPEWAASSAATSSAHLAAWRDSALEDAPRMCDDRCRHVRAAIHLLDAHPGGGRRLTAAARGVRPSLRPRPPCLPGRALARLAAAPGR